MNTQMSTPFIRVNITIPQNLISELEKEVPNRGKSGFISEAIEEKLIREKRGKALKAALEMLTLAKETRKELKNLPADLRDKANEILYSK